MLKRTHQASSVINWGADVFVVVISSLSPPYLLTCYRSEVLRIPATVRNKTWDPIPPLHLDLLRDIRQTIKSY